MLEVIITFFVGIASFISPCVFPLVPAYIGYMGGRVTNTVGAQVAVASASHTSPSAVAEANHARFSTFLHGVAFVSGFTFIFVILGVAGTLLIQLGGRATVTDLIGRIGGMMIIFFGLHFMGIIPALFRRLRQRPAVLDHIVLSVALTLVVALLALWGFTGTLMPWEPGPLGIPGWTIATAAGFIILWTGLLAAGGAFTEPGHFWLKAMNTFDRAFYADTRRQMTAGGQQGFAGSAFMGVVFAAGWTPCLGPQLGTALTFAGTEGEVARGAILLASYSLGLGIPFLLTALTLDSVQGLFRRIQRHMHTIEVVTGVFLIFIGFTIATGRLQQWSLALSTDFADFSYQLEECVADLFRGDVALSGFTACVRDDASEATAAETSADSAAQSDTAAALQNAPSVEILAEGSLPVGLGEGERAPDFEAQTLSGDNVRLSDYRGQVVILNFWFTTCGPCLREMPDLQAAYDAYSEDGFIVLAINRQDPTDEIESFMVDLDLTLPVVLDPDGNLQRRFSIAGYPSSYVLDPQGVIIEANYRGVLTPDQIEALIRDAAS